jgi:hypothetical protein
MGQPQLFNTDPSPAPGYIRLAPTTDHYFLTLSIYYGNFF